MPRHTIFLSLLLILAATAHAQQDDLSRVPMGADSIPIFRTRGLQITAPWPNEKARRAYERQQKEINRLRHNMRIVYPLALKAAAIVEEMEREAGSFKKSRDKKAYYKRLEKELFQKYEKQLKNLSVNQGRLLIKLIDRETDMTAYEIIKEYKSGTAAVFWQLVAKLFGNSLKAGYKPSDEPLIETIIEEMRSGEYAYYYGPSVLYTRTQAPQPQ